MPIYNNPALGQAFGNLAAMFAPPSGADAAGWARANAERAEAARRQAIYDYANSPGYDQATADRMGVLGGLYAPNQSFYSVDQGNATARRGQDVAASTSRANNTADNDTARRGQDVAASTSRANNTADNETQRYGYDTQASTSRANNAADNTRALQDRQMQEDASLARLYAAPVKVGQNETVYLPPATAAAAGLPGTLAGPAAPLTDSQALAQIIMRQDPTTQDQFARDKFAPTETQVQGQERRRLAESGQLTDQQLRDVILGERAPVQTVGPDGKPRYMAPGEAARTGAEAVPAKAPSTTVNLGPNGVPYGDPEKGTVWARNPDGTVKLDERGAPIAIPYQGGSVYAQQQSAEKSAGLNAQRNSAKQNIVVQDIDRTLARVIDNPTLTTGVGAQITGGIGGSPAYDVNALLDTIKANVGFEQLQQMREASPTGGALGQVSEQENRLLQSVLGSLQSSQGTPQFVDNLKRLKNVYLDIVHGPGEGPPREDLSFDTAPAGGNAPPASSAPVAVSSPEEARRLPSGTAIQLPDGRIGRVP
ncbi:hypothetical protein NPA31_011940 [Aurantimonas sp. MSK8Z-1]|uniref:hypothetical protein n=1 Tax=Mangrovibrevibacter kandeliae TaxID=2968473 RepID=UPI00222E2C9E|nr:hypothetical protein [Aurantimonas sp. MSK8Z-1]MCW4115675.1 hypothetical protein [Aurantimonas sp. MSK8Z-1]